MQELDTNKCFAAHHNCQKILATVFESKLKCLQSLHLMADWAISMQFFLLLCCVISMSVIYCKLIVLFYTQYELVCVLDSK